MPGTVKVPGELHIDREERAAAMLLYGIDTSRLVIVEPNVKHMAPNKKWRTERYGEVARVLTTKGYVVGQFSSAGPIRLADAKQFHADSFMTACAVLSRARIFIGPEGGLHHAAAALGKPAVVIFGGYISPKVTGYAMHTNLFTGDRLGCGAIDPCTHCRTCMGKITVADVLEPALRILGETDDRRTDAVEVLSQAQY